MHNKSRRSKQHGEAQGAAAAAVDGRVPDGAARRRAVDAGGEARGASLPPGAEIALIGADPMSTGITAYMRLKAGYKLPAARAHAHLVAHDAVGQGHLDHRRQEDAVDGGHLRDRAVEADARVRLRRRRRLRLLAAPLGPTDYIWSGK